MCLFLDRNIFPKVSLSIFNYSSLKPCFSLSVCMVFQLHAYNFLRKVTWANQRNYLPWRALKLCNNSKHKTWLVIWHNHANIYKKIQNLFPLVCWHCHPFGLANYKGRSSGWRISVLTDACMWKCLQKHASAISQNNPDCTSEHCSLYHCLNMRHPFANLPTSQSSRWSHSALQRKPSSKVSTREQVLQLTLHDKKPTDCDSD